MEMLFKDFWHGVTHTFKIFYFYLLKNILMALKEREKLVVLNNIISWLHLSQGNAAAAAAAAAKLIQSCPTAAHQAPPPMGFSRQEYWTLMPLKAGVPRCRDLMPDALGWNWCNGNRHKVHCTYNALETSPNHPLTLVPGKTVFHETGPWCQKDWGPLV